jgi:hypothetical protein
MSWTARVWGLAGARLFVCHCCIQTGPFSSEDEANHFPPSSADVNPWSITSIPPHFFVAWCLNTEPVVRYYLSICLEKVGIILRLLMICVTPCGPVCKYQDFGPSPSLDLKMEIVFSTETFVSTYQSTWRQTSEQKHRREKSVTIIGFPTFETLTSVT